MKDKDHLRKILDTIGRLKASLYGPKQGSLAAALILIGDTAIRIAGFKNIEGFDSEAVLTTGARAVQFALTLWIVLKLLEISLDTAKRWIQSELGE